MTYLLAPTLAAILVSYIKPLMFLFFIWIWGYLATKIDKQSKKHRLKQFVWNTVILASGIIATIAWFFSPLFSIGTIIGLLCLCAGWGIYVYFHNREVSEDDQIEISFSALMKYLEQHRSDSVQAAFSATSVFLLNENGPLEPPSKNAPFAKAHIQFAELVEFAFERNATRIDVSIRVDKARVVAQIDGVNYLLPDIAAQLGASMIDYLKSQTGLNLEERRKRQTANVKVKCNVSNTPRALHIATWGSTREVVISLMFQKSKAQLLKFEELGLLREQVSSLVHIFEGRNRVVLVTCPPGHGQSTTLYDFVAKHDPYMSNVVTLEERQEQELEGVVHQQVEPRDMRARLSSLLRQDPGVILMSQTDTGHLTQLIADSSATVRYYVGMHQEDTFSTLNTWLKAVGDPRVAALSLEAIVAQRLVRKLCPTCRVSFPPDPAILQKLNLTGRVDALYRSSGQVMGKNNQPSLCPDCKGLGFIGRTGVFEVMTLDDEARDILATGNMDEFRNYQRRQGMMWLQEAALGKVVEGETSIQEVTRALGKDADKVIPLPTKAAMIAKARYD